MNWDNQNNKDPWGGKNEAPDFDDLMKKFSSILGGKKSSSNSSGDNSGGNGGFKMPIGKVLSYAFFGLLVITAFQSIYIIDETDRAVNYLMFFLISVESKKSLEF